MLQRKQNTIYAWIIHFGWHNNNLISSLNCIHIIILFNTHFNAFRICDCNNIKQLRCFNSVIPCNIKIHWWYKLFTCFYSNIIFTHFTFILHQCLMQSIFIQLISSNSIMFNRQLFVLTECDRYTLSLRYITTVTLIVVTITCTCVSNII